MPQRTPSRPGASERLSPRALNRALLARQLLLQRAPLPVDEAVERLVGMQAQQPRDPYLGLWTRLAPFHPDDLARLLIARRLVRAPLLRTTIHLVTARDCLSLWPLLRESHARTLANTPFGKATAALDQEELVAMGRALLEVAPRTARALGQGLRERWPDIDAASLAAAVHYRLPLVQIPPRGLWDASGQATWVTAEQWLGRPLDPAPALAPVLLRYLAAFGPASVADMRTWSGLTGLGEVVAHLRPRLRVFRDERNRELIDLPDALRPDPETPAPPRFLPQFDNLLLSHADRARVIDEAHRKRLQTPNGTGPGTVLVDGFVRATWRIVQEHGVATLWIETLEPLTRTEQDEVAAEGMRLLGFLAADATQGEVRFRDEGMS